MDSDEEYVQDLSDEEVRLSGRKQAADYGTRSNGLARGKQVPGGRSKERWEDIQRSWDLVKEGADGSLSGAVEGLLEAGKRRRLLRDTTPLQRGIIRHLALVIDMSSAMMEKDMRPTRYLLTLRYAQDFTIEFFEQNPISQMCVFGMRDGLVERISEMSGSPNDHITALQDLRVKEPKGTPSLQNALEMARAALFHAPSHGTREVIIIFGALLSSDPGDIHQTIRALVCDKVCVSVVGLAARIAVCTELTSQTNRVSKEDNSVYGVAMHEQHFRDLLLSHTVPPITRASDQSSAPCLLMMGFPSRIDEDHPSFCACHGVISRGGYLCSRCRAKVCSLPTQCPTCDLQLIQSTHLARSYHHLFPLLNYQEVSWHDARRKGSMRCFSCLASFPPVPVGEDLERSGGNQQGWRELRKGASQSSRYACTTCTEHFCIDCDVFAHEVVHNCSGCLCKPLVVLDVNRSEIPNGYPKENGNGVSEPI